MYVDTEQKFAQTGADTARWLARDISVLWPMAGGVGAHGWTAPEPVDAETDLVFRSVE